MRVHLLGETEQVEEQKPKTPGCYLLIAVIALVVVLVVEWLRPEIIPFELFQFWKLNGSIWDVMKASWPLFVWGITRNVIQVIRKRNNPELNKHAEVIIGLGCLVSTWAGVVEELAFRWIIFYGEIVGYTFINFILFGFQGTGLIEWIFMNVSGPIANVLTLGLMHNYLFSSLGWAVGAAMVSSNGQFGEGHSYQGFFGWINSWFIGMFFFYLMFQYGLFTSIIVHFLYDMFLFIVDYIDAFVERALGWT